MTLLLLGVGAVAGVLGTRAAALFFLAAAVLGADSALPAVATWTAVTAAGLTAMKASPRRLALPALGTAAAIGAGSARNTAVVLALWVLATATAAVSRGPRSESARWAATLCACDVPVVAAVAWVALSSGFEDWPLQIDNVAVVLLLVAAAARASLASGPDDDHQEVGLLTVRTQTVVLLVLGLGVNAVDRQILVGAVLIGAAGFAVSASAVRSATRDVVQEASLVALMLAGARLGWMESGWEWGALAGGTLIHSLRLRLRSEDIGPLAGAILGGGGIGLAFLPAVLVGLEGAPRARGWQGVALVAGLVAGLGGRLTSESADEPRKGVIKEGRWQRLVSVGLLGAAVVAGLWAPALSVPRSAAGSAIAWPPAWAFLVVALAGTAAALRSLPIQQQAGSIPDRSPRRTYPRMPDLRLPGWSARPGLIRAGLIGLASVAVGIWVVGVFRGFL